MAKVTSHLVGAGSMRADCVTCGDAEPTGDDRDHDRQRAWARLHVAENPGHSVHVIHERTRAYTAAGPAEA